MEDNNTKQLDIEAVKSDEPKQTNDEEKLSRARFLLQNLQQGWKVTVARSAPSWARSHLETFEVLDGAEPIDIDYLIKRWGGQALTLAIHDEHGKWVTKATIPAYSFPPKVYGKTITEMDVLGFGQPSATPHREQMPANQTVERYNPQPSPMNQGLMGLGMTLPELLKLMQGSSKAESMLLVKLLERQISQPPQQYAPPPAQQSPLKLMREMMEMQMMMKEMGEQMGFGGGGGGGEDDPLGSLGPMLGSLAQNFMNRPPAPRRRPDRRPPRRGAPPPPPQQPARVVPPQQPQQFVNDRSRELPPEPQQSVNTEPVEQNLRELSDSLTNLSPNDSADVVLEAFENMPEDKREQAMQAFFTKMQGGEVDELTNSPDVYSQDEYPDEYDQSPPEVRNPYDQTQNQGGTVPATEGNDPADWGSD